MSNDLLANFRSGSPTIRQSPFGYTGGDPSQLFADLGGGINPSGFVSNVDNAPANVIIDDTGITIIDGALTLSDQFGNNVLTGAGFGASWLDFISGGFYNGWFSVGSTTNIVAATIVGTASTEADYLASLSNDLPYWAVASESGAGTFVRVVDSTAVGGYALQWSGTETAEIFQDIPVVPGRRHTVLIAQRFTNSASEFTRTVGAQYRTSTHAATGALVEEAQPYTTTQAAYDVGWALDVGVAPADARYMRVSVEYARVSGSPTVWLNGVLATGSAIGPLTVQEGEIIFYDVEQASSRVLSTWVVSESNPRLIVTAAGQLLIGGGTGVADVNLYRPAAGELQTDNHFYAADGIQMKVKAGVPTDADFTIDASGNCILDTTNSRIYFRVGTTWKYAALT